MKRTALGWVLSLSGSKQSYFLLLWVFRSFLLSFTTQCSTSLAPFWECSEWCSYGCICPWHQTSRRCECRSCSEQTQNSLASWREANRESLWNLLTWENFEQGERKPSLGWKILSNISLEPCWSQWWPDSLKLLHTSPLTLLSPRGWYLVPKSLVGLKLLVNMRPSLSIFSSSCWVHLCLLTAHCL